MISKKTYHEYKANRNVFIFLMVAFFIAAAINDIAGLLAFLIVNAWGIYMGYRLIHNEPSNEEL